jgi:hypothetical protein
MAQSSGMMACLPVELKIDAVDPKNKYLTRLYNKMEDSVKNGVIAANIVNNIYSLDDFITYANQGHSIDRQYTNNAFGLNMDFGMPAVTKAKEKEGMIFFTRPQLNLEADNLINANNMAMYLNDNRYSSIRYCRCILDPRLIARNGNSVGYGDYCPLVDNKNGFIPILSNNCMGLSGFPDLFLRTYVTERGIKNDQWGMVDSDYVYYDEYDLSASFFNTKDNIVNILLEMWLKYMGNVYMGKVLAYPDYIATRTLCYNTRIYRVVLDDFNKRVTRIAACGASFPVTLNNGANFDYIRDEVVKSTEEISVQFKAFGFLLNDMMLIKEFNEVCAIFNPNYRKLTRYWMLALMLSNSNSMVKIDREIDLTKNVFKMRKVHDIYMTIFNNHAYPFINPLTSEFEWYVDSETPYYKLLVELGVVDDNFLILFTSFNFNKLGIPTIIDTDILYTANYIQNTTGNSLTSSKKKK